MVSAKTLLSRSKDLSKISTEVLQNKFVLYFVFVLAVGNLFHFVFRQDLMSVGIFIATGLLTSFFSKNMTVIMVITMVVANIFQIGKGRDGFADKGDDNDDEEAFEDLEEGEEGFEDDDEEDKKEAFGDDDEEEDKKEAFGDDDEEEDDKKRKESFYSYRR